MEVSIGWLILQPRFVYVLKENNIIVLNGRNSDRPSGRIQTNETRGRISKKINQGFIKYMDP